MTERASDLLSGLADRLSADSRDSGQVVAESVRTLEPELLRMQKDGGSIDELVRTSVGFLEILFRSLRADSRVPWQQYYALAREASRRYAEKGIPLESVMEGLRLPPIGDRSGHGRDGRQRTRRRGPAAGTEPAG